MKHFLPDFWHHAGQSHLTSLSLLKALSSQHVLNRWYRRRYPLKKPHQTDYQGDRKGPPHLSAPPSPLPRYDGHLHRGWVGGLLDIEEMTEEDLNRLRVHYAKLASAARDDLRRGVQDTGTPQG